MLFRSLLGCILKSMFYFDIYLQDVMKENWVLQGIYVFLIVGLFCTLFVAAHATYVINAEMEEWQLGGELRQQRDIFLGSKFGTHLNVNVVIKDRIGLRSPFGMFTVTYGFVGTVFSTTLTYAVVCLQLR